MKQKPKLPIDVIHLHGWQLQHFCQALSKTRLSCSTTSQDPQPFKVTHQGCDLGELPLPLLCKAMTGTPPQAEKHKNCNGQKVEGHLVINDPPVLLYKFFHGFFNLKGADECQHVPAKFIPQA